MNIIKNVTTNKNTNYVKKANPNNSSKINLKNENKDILDIFSEKVVNKKDITDMVKVPRTIFKGYLCFTAGTALTSIGGLIKKAPIKNIFMIGGLASTIYGTYNFVKPFLIKDEN